MLALPAFTDAEILKARPDRPDYDPWQPSAFLIEREVSRHGSLDEVAALFLTNRECPFRCTMCDLWKYTLSESVPPGAIPAQIDFALARLPPAQHVKLYNAGNFFDPRAIPVVDLAAIANRVRGFETVIVENHPRLTDDRCLSFRDQLGTHLEVAVGLETVHPELLAWLNKRMTVDDFDRAARFLRDHDMGLRVFLLLGLPGLDRRSALAWTQKSLVHAFDRGATCCSIIALRSGNGTLDALERAGEFVRPRLRDLEQALEQGLALERGRVFADLWGLESVVDCTECSAAVRDRLEIMNRTQSIPGAIACSACQSIG